MSFNMLSIFRFPIIWNQLLSISHSTIPSSIDPNRAMPSRLGPQKLRTWQNSMEDLQSWLPQIAKGCCNDHSDATWCIQYGATFSNHQTSYKTSTWFHTSKSFKTSTTVRPCDIWRIDCCSLLMVTYGYQLTVPHHIAIPIIPSLCAHHADSLPASATTPWQCQQFAQTSAIFCARTP